MQKRQLEVEALYLVASTLQVNCWHELLGQANQAGLSKAASTMLAECKDFWLFPHLNPSTVWVSQVLECQSVYFVVCGNEPLLICFLPTNLYYVLLSIIFPVSMMLPTSKPVPEKSEVLQNKCHGHSTKICVSLSKRARGLAVFVLFSFTPISFVLLYPFVTLCLSLCCKLLQASMSSVCSAKCFFRQ